MREASSLLVRRRLSALLLRLAAGLSFVSRRIYESPQQTLLRRWAAIDGDKTLRLQYDLGEDSIVFDVGGYQGQWASDISAMYSCWVHVFEPIEQFADQIRQRFARNGRIMVWPFGLSGKDQTVQMGLAGDSSSVFRSGEALVRARLVCLAQFARDQSVGQIDLMKVNIEGGEYDLLDHLLETGLIRVVRDLQVQFHEGLVPNAEQRMRAIQLQLRETHRLTYQYPYVWENWRAWSAKGDPGT